jgi:Fe-S oxidoreductase
MCCRSLCPYREVTHDRINSPGSRIRLSDERQERRANAHGEIAPDAAQCLPPGMTNESLHDALKAEGFVIYAGQGNITSADIDRLLHCIARLPR